MPVVFGRNYPIQPRWSGLARYLRPPGEAHAAELPAETGTASGRPGGGHLFYAINGARWWLLWVTAVDDTLLRSAWSTDLVTWTPAESTDLTWGLDSGLNLSVAYANISSTDVVHIGYGKRVSATSHRSYHLRATIADDVVTFGTSAEVTPSATGNDGGTVYEDATTVLVASDLKIFHSSSYIDASGFGNANTAVSTNTDIGSSWTPGFGTATRHEVAGVTVESAVALGVGSGTVLLLFADGAAASTFNDLRWVKWTGTWSAPAAVFASTSAQDNQDWAAVARTTTDVHVVRRLTSTTYEHRRYNGTSFSAGQAIPTQANKAGAGLFVASDGADVWLFAISSDAANTVRYVKWSSGSSTWGSWTDFETSTQVRTGLSGAELVGADSQLGVIWTEVADNHFQIVSKPLVMAAGATVTPAAVAATATLPAPTVAAGSGVTPAAILASSTVGAPGLSAGSRVSPAAIAAVASLPAPTVSAGSALAPAAIAATTSLPAPTVSAGARPTPAAVAASTTLPAPAVLVGSQAAPAAVAASSSIPPAAVSAGSTVAPAAIVATASIPAPTVTAGGATVTPAAVAASTTLPAPTVSAGSTVAPAAVAAAATLPPPGVSAGSRVSPAAVQAAATVPAVAVSAGSRVTPAAVQASTSLPAPAVSAGGNVTVAAAAILVFTTLPAPALSAGSRVAAPVIVAAASLPAPVLSSAADVFAAAVLASLTTPAPAVSTSVVVTPAAVFATVSMPTATVVSGEPGTFTSSTSGPLFTTSTAAGRAASSTGGPSLTPTSTAPRWTVTTAGG